MCATEPGTGSLVSCTDRAHACDRLPESHQWLVFPFFVSSSYPVLTPRSTCRRTHRLLDCLPAVSDAVEPVSTDIDTQFPDDSEIIISSALGGVERVCVRLRQKIGSSARVRERIRQELRFQSPWFQCLCAR